MSNNRYIGIACAAFILCGAQVQAQSIAEKKAGFKPVGGDLNKDLQKALGETNKSIADNHAELERLYAQVMVLYRDNAPPESYEKLLADINMVRNEIEELENNWRLMASQVGSEQSYALWHQPESTLGQLVMDYGSQDYVYMMPADIANIKVSVDSNIPIPRSSWNEMMELILAQNGVGIKQLNPFLRQLYFFKQDRSAIRLITNTRNELEYLSPDTRICFVLSPEPSDVRRIWAFLDKFVNPNSTTLQQIGRDILIIAPVDEVLDLLKLYDFVLTNKGDKDYKIKPISKVNADEMAKILAAIFDQFVEPVKGGEPGQGSASLKSLVEPIKDRKDGGSSAPVVGGGGPVVGGSQGAQQPDLNSLRIIPLKHIAQAVFLIGTKEEIKKAEEIIDQVENQVGAPREKLIYWYTTKHSEPEELGQVLQKIYTLMTKTTKEAEDEERQPGQLGGGPGAASLSQAAAPSPTQQVAQPIPAPNGVPYSPSRLYQGDFYQQGTSYVVNPVPTEPTPPPKITPNQGRDNFIVDPKTGTLVMVVEAHLLPKMKELIKKLDVPKKMVQIETLVFERRLLHTDNFGLNLLRLGDAASNKDVGSLIWNDSSTAGIFDYILSQAENHGIPAFDLIYRFLISQQDLTINANPTIVTLNQTQAKISIVEEISINNGVLLINTAGGTQPQTTFTRSQYGITIFVTPTIHMNEDRFEGSDEPSYVTLQTDITFDTLQPSATVGQPTVLRRNVHNEVRIPDGQTVVIGGLRRKDTQDARDSIPYLGEIPGFGKLFSNRGMHDDAIELFIFLTPKIIADPAEDFARLREEILLYRPGDIPEFLCCLNEAHELEKNKIFAGTINALFGPQPERCVPEHMLPLRGEYDGR